MNQHNRSIKWLLHLAKDFKDVTGKNLKFEIRNPFGTTTRIISDLRPSVTDKGHFSAKTIILKEDGRESAYDGKLEVVLVKIIGGGVSRPAGARLRDAGQGAV